MIGHPKRLEDLDRINAGVKVTCQRCRRERLLDRATLIRYLTRRGLTTSWDMLPKRLRCACGSRTVEIVAMPFTSGEEDGEALFERLIREFERRQSLMQRDDTGSADWCREASDGSAELHQAKVAMRAWIVARSQ